MGLYKLISLNECDQFETQLRNFHLSFLRKNPFDMISTLTCLYESSDCDSALAHEANQYNCMGVNQKLVAQLNESGIDAFVGIFKPSKESEN